MRPIHVCFMSVFQMENSGVVHMLQNNKTDGKYCNFIGQIILYCPK